MNIGAAVSLAFMAAAIVCWFVSFLIVMANIPFLEDRHIKWSGRLMTCSGIAIATSIITGAL